MGNIPVSSLSLLCSANSNCKAFLLAFNKLLDPLFLQKPQLRLHEMQHNTALGNQKKVFSIITYYMYLANQKHLWWVWLKQSHNNSKIRLRHAGSLHTHWKLHCTIVAVGPFEAVFLAGHICGNEYQICFCSHKLKPSAPFLKSI